MSKLGYIDLSGSWLISAVPALAYAIAYLSRLGEAFARKLPVDWITISLTDALSRTAAVALVVLTMFLSSRAEESWVRRRPRWTHRAAAHFFDQLAPLTMFLFLLGEHSIAASFAGVFALVTLAMAVRDYRRRDSLPVKKVKSLGVVVLKAPQQAGQNPVTQVAASWVLAAVAAALLLAPLTGWLRGLEDRDALVDRNHTTIVAASYGRLAVIADLEVTDDGRWVVGRSRRLIDLVDSEDLALEADRSEWPIDW